jgi:predicted AAA+ superfamily ATPase
MGRDVFDRERLPSELDEFLRSVNPWWEGKRGKPQPKFKRWAFETTLKRLDSGLAPAVVIRGPRQVGKTTLQMQIIETLLEERKVQGSRILRVQFDEIPSLRKVAEPVLAIARWFENRVLGRSFNDAARANQPAYLMFDEVQNLKDWAPQLKSLVDHHSVKVLVTGSSALRIEAGKDSLAGRITEVELGTLHLREILGLRFAERVDPYLPTNGLEPLLRREFWDGLEPWALGRKVVRDLAFRGFSERGGYPMAQANPNTSWPEIADQLNETVIKRAIQHDLRIGARGVKRDPQLLEEVFRLACRYAGQAPSQALFVSEIKNALSANIGWQRILKYLQFLDGAMLIRLIRPMELRLKKQKGNSKVCLCDHGLRASWLEEVVPLDPEGLKASPHLADIAGHIAESVVGYTLSGIPHLDVAHFPERGAEPEVDFVLTVGEKRIPMEVKYRQRIDPLRDTVGLRAFLEKAVYNAPFGIMVTLHDQVRIDDPRIIPVSLSSLLMMR